MISQQTREVSSLLNPDLYHIPGYDGFCPKLRFKCGDTFGNATRKLFAESAESYRGNQIPLQCKFMSKGDELSLKKRDLIKNRTNIRGDVKLASEMIPGYTGCVPRSQNYFGNTYTLTCENALAEFESDRLKREQKMRDLGLDPQPIKVGSKPGEPFQLELKRHRDLPMSAIAAEPGLYYSPYELETYISPYYMPPPDPMKYFMSGYSGFIPRSTNKIGLGFPKVTNNSLIEFQNDMIRNYKTKDQPVTVFLHDPRPPQKELIYRTHTGLIPKYAGHIPGENQAFGKTFGNSTVNARSRLFQRSLTN